MKPLTSKIAVIVVCLISALMVNAIIDYAFGGYHTDLLVHGQTFILIIIFLVLASGVTQALNRVMLYFWFFFFLCGLMFLNTAALSDPKFGHLGNLNSDNFYFYCLIALASGFLASE